MRNSDPDDEHELCRLDAKLKLSAITPRKKENKTCTALHNNINVDLASNLLAISKSLKNPC